MCRHASRPLAPEPHAAASARAFLRERFTDWGLEELIPDAELALSELVTNAVLHAGTPLEVSISASGGTVELAVHDGDTRLPELRPHRHDLHADLQAVLATEADHFDAGHSELLDDRDPRLDIGPAGSLAGGRGLLLVDAVAASWGVTPRSDGKAVWVRTPVPEGWLPAAECPCEDDQLPASMLASGHSAVHVSG